MIKITDLKKSFGEKEVLKGISEEIHKGEVVSIIGPSGSGKSTFLRCLNLLEQPTDGNIVFEGTDITDKSIKIEKYRQKIGMVFQHFNVFPHLTTLENITITPVLEKKIPKNEAEKQAIDLLTKVGLGDKKDVYPRSLSGGQKQRLCIARALLKNPKILILDDSTSAVDTATEAKITKHLNGELDHTTKIIIAQRVSSVVGADMIVVMNDGKIEATGTHRELLESSITYQEIYYSQMDKEVQA